MFMDIELGYSIIEILQTMEEAAKEMKAKYVAGDIQGFNNLSIDLWDGITAVRDVVEQKVPEGSRIRLADVCICALDSLKDITMFAITNPEKTEWKLEYELIPIIEVGTMQFYYWAIVEGHPEAKKEFELFLRSTDTFRLLDIPKEERKYELDLSIIVLGYNHLDYTIQCVDSVLENTPSNIKSEIVILNHGSTDDTKKYFENMKEVKVINVAINGVVPGVTWKAISQAKYHLGISNDIVIGTNAIQNLYLTAKQNKEYGFIVPTTPSVSNLQSVNAEYNTIEQFLEFTARNNIYNDMRHEQRIRLCNPLQIMPSELVIRMYLEQYINIWCVKNAWAFPDDKISLWMRRNGYKCILAKDAYCHHFGSITLKQDLGKQGEQERFYLEGRIEFLSKYGVDPWGVGFCYDYNLFQSWKIPAIDNAHILGINCGLGSNSLKIKEVMREKGAENVVLYNGTQNENFLEDLKGVSDNAFVFSALGEIKEITGRCDFDYIIIDEALANVDMKNIKAQILKAGLQFRELAYRVAEKEWEIIKN